RTCVVCGKRDNQRNMRTFTLTEWRRVEWIRALTQTPEQEKDLIERMNKSDKPRLCESHFGPECFDVTPDAVILRTDAIPRYTVPLSRPYTAEKTNAQYPSKKETVEYEKQLLKSSTTRVAIDPVLPSSLVGWKPVKVDKISEKEMKKDADQ
ncbi:hypothetical protein PFISCL1PPCAC_21556, partial [Pristionchus fissidentatus]